MGMHPRSSGSAAAGPGRDNRSGWSEASRKLGVPAIPISAETGANVQEKLLPAMLDAVPRLAVPLGRELTGLRRAATRRVIRQAAAFSGLMGAQPVPMLDIPLQAMVQVGVVMRVGAAFGHAPTGGMSKEVIGTVISTLGLRYLALTLAKFVPFIGWPVKQILVPKKDMHWRPLTLWTIRDRVAQRATYNYLEPVFDRQFLACSFGFRSGRSTQDAAEATLQARRDGAYWVLDADIKDCFGQMRNKIVMKQLNRWGVPGPISELIRRWLHTRIGNAWRKEQTIAGTSQGSVISPLLCNMYLHPFDQAMQQRGITLVRYADDFLIMARHKAAIHGAQVWAAANLKRLGLEMKSSKTRITNFEEGFQFVGWFFVQNQMFRLK